MSQRLAPFRTLAIDLRVIQVKRVGLIILICAFAFSQISIAMADDKAKEIARGLLKGLIESQLERQERDSFGNRNRPPGPVNVPQPQRATPEMLQLRQLLTSMSTEAEALSAQLANDSRRSFNVRPMQPEAMRFQASTAAIRQRTERESSHQILQFPIQTLTQEWKTLGHQINENRGVSKQTRDCVERINRLDAQICQIYGLREQFNSRELMRSADLMAADLKTLTDELSFATGNRGPRGGLANRMRRLQDQSTLFANLVASGAQYQTVVAEYQSLYQSWISLQPELGQYTSRSFTVPVTRVQQIHRTIHQLLRLEFGPDFALIQQMASNLDGEITALFRSVSLDQIMLLPDSRSLPSTADAFSGNCQNLIDVVRRRESLQAIGEAWVYLDEQWNLMEFYLRTSQVPETRRRLEGIGQTVAALKEAIGVNVSFDRNSIIQKTTELASLSDHLSSTVRRWTARTGQQNIQLNQKVAQLQTVCEEMSTLAISHRSEQLLRAKCDSSIIIFQELRPMIDSCQTQERESIEQTIDRFIPALVQLSTMLEEQ